MKTTLTRAGSRSRIQAGRSVRVVEKDSPLAILQEMARLLGLGQKPAKLGRAKGQPEAKEATVAELMASLEARRREAAASPAL